MNDPFGFLLAVALMLAPAIAGFIFEAKAKGRERGEYCLLFVPGLGHVLLLLFISLTVIGAPFVAVEKLKAKWVKPEEGE